MGRASMHMVLPVVAVMALAMMQAQAASPVLDFWDFTFNDVVSGDTPETPAPWAKLRVEDTGTAGEVQMTLWASLKGTNEFISRLWLNVDPYIYPVAIKPGSISGISSITLSQDDDPEKSNTRQSSSSSR